MRLLLSKNSCSRLCTTLSNDLERKDRFDTGLYVSPSSGWCSVRPSSAVDELRLALSRTGNNQQPVTCCTAPKWLLRNYDATKYAVSKLTLTQRCSLIFMKFQHCCRYVQLCCRYGRLCRQCVRGQSNTVDFVDFPQSRPCWIQLCCQCVPGFIVSYIRYRLNHRVQLNVVLLSLA